MKTSEHILKHPMPVRLDKKTITAIKKLAKREGGLAFSTMLRVLILEAIKSREAKKDV